MVRKTSIWFLFLIIFLSILPMTTLAHTPADMELKYDFNDQQLNVTITHNVATPNSHYIKNVKIWKNDNLIVDENYTSQPTLSSFTYSYDITTIDGDVLKVTATCSISGDITEQTTVNDPKPGNKNIALELEPSTFTQIEENDVQDFRLTITSNGEPLEGYSVNIITDHGTISDETVKSNGRYEFDYNAPEVTADTNDIINITILKNGYNNSYAEIRFVITDRSSSPGPGPGPGPSQTPTLDGEISDNEYDFIANFADGNFKIHWKLSGDSITFGIEGKTTGWISIGFGSLVMSGSDMVIGWVDTQGSVTVIDCYTQTGSRQHPADTNQGGIDNILEFGGSENNGWTIIEFKRLLQTGDDKDQDIPSGGKLKIIWAIGNGDNLNDPHSQRGSGSINFATGEAEEDDVLVLWPFHAIFMILGFIFMLKAIIIAHFLKKEKWWLKAHKTINKLAVVFAIIGLIIAINMVTDAKTGHLRVPHAFLGIITIIIILITPALGYAQFKTGGNKGIKTAHRVFGYIALFLMLIMIISGLIQAGVI